MLPRMFLAPLLAATTVGLVACGDDKKDGATAPATTAATRAQAAAEARQTGTALDAALKTYAAGDQAGAAEQVANAYVEHFEHVEHPLEQVDTKLKEKLEEAIGTDIRAQMKRKAPAAKVKALITAARADLVTAEGKLK
jgi:hypothetical protein